MTSGSDEKSSSAVSTSRLGRIDICARHLDRQDDVRIVPAVVGEFALQRQVAKTSQITCGRCFVDHEPPVNVPAPAVVLQAHDDRAAGNRGQRTVLPEEQVADRDLRVAVADIQRPCAMNTDLERTSRQLAAGYGVRAVHSAVNTEVEPLLDRGGAAGLADRSFRDVRLGRWRPWIAVVIDVLVVPESVPDGQLVRLGIFG